MHIRQGTSQSKTKCIFFPPHQFLQHSQRHAVAATAHSNNYTMQIVEQPAPSLSCPTNFPVGYCIIVALSHPTHAGKEGRVCQHTKKYIVFMPKEHSSNVICILPTSLAHCDGRCNINSSNDDKEHNPGQTEREHEMYDQLDKTQTFLVANGFVSFTQTF
jgi:hypothetical protein